MTPIYQLIKSYIEENFDTMEEITKELEGMKLAQKSLGNIHPVRKVSLGPVHMGAENKLERV